MNEKVHKITMDKEFKACPLCSYQDGFHTMLQKDEEKTHWLFICPACHEIFDIGQQVK